MKKILLAISGISFLAILGIVGNIEQGGELVKMLWCIPLIVVFGISALMLGGE